ncbi:MAG: ABC transporter ATP-binding protein [Lachnospiraceae bacterium]|jgi:ABC-2 type transport system ATP-binding protein|nr:ABC transporter ATP-binding protein [Lachnospiraceae bacterium]MCI9014955.1 ABC transporter ATP-binding protein [Lachnospiraceae bacterium]MCI9256046.1 ABC transporter ATP-binding protein [Lachnospiraceae bacterium]
MELLEVRNLSKEYKTFLLDNISFTLARGYIMGYVGQNGAGKSTTLNLITNICKSSSGEIYVDGITCEEDESRYKESIGYIGDEFYFPDNFRIRDIRSVLRDFYKTFRTEKFDELTKRWKLDGKMAVKDFSRGMKVKLMFASVLARDTKLLVLDEATNGLDPVVRVEVLKLLQEYIADGERSVIFSTHILSDLEQIADYIYFIHEGKTVLYDAKDELLESHLLVKGERRAIYPELQRALIGIMDNAYGFEAILPSDRADLLTNEFHFEKPTIDQIVIHYIREREG